MIAATILYPNNEGSKFDLDYYTNTHMPMFAERLGEACQSWGVIDTHGQQYHAIGWVVISSQEALNAALTEHGAEITGDVANYTDVAPTFVVGDVVK